MMKYLIQPNDPASYTMKGEADSLEDALQAAWDMQRYHDRDINIYEVHEGAPALMATLSLTWFARSNDD